MALSRDIRKRLIEAYENKEGSIKNLAKRFKIATSTIWELLKRYRATQQLAPISPPGRTPKVGEKELKLIENLVRKKSDATLSTLCTEFEAKTGMKIGTTTMHRACSRLKLHYKKNGVRSGTKTS